MTEERVKNLPSEINFRMKLRFVLLDKGNPSASSGYNKNYNWIPVFTGMTEEEKSRAGFRLSPE